MRGSGRGLGGTKVDGSSAASCVVVEVSAIGNHVTPSHVLTRCLSTTRMSLLNQYQASEPVIWTAHGTHHIYRSKHHAQRLQSRFASPQKHGEGWISYKTSCAIISHLLSILSPSHPSLLDGTSIRPWHPPSSASLSRNHPAPRVPSP